MTVQSCARPRRARARESMRPALSDARRRRRRVMPGKYVPMGVQIMQVDIAQPLPTLPTSAGGTAGGRRDGAAAPLWILVKLGPQPVGWVRCDAKAFGQSIEPDRLLQVIHDALDREIRAAAREGAHEPIAPLLRPPSFSIVICTRDDNAAAAGAAALERQLESIAKIGERGGVEVIVIDRGVAVSPSRLAVAAKFPFVRYAHDPRPGVNYARNTGWQLARHEIIAYLHEGAIVDGDWLTALAANYVD